MVEMHQDDKQEGLSYLAMISFVSWIQCVIERRLLLKTDRQTKAMLEDPRYKIANREALIGTVIAIANFLWWFGFAYGFGSKDVSAYQYVFGLPAWFFYSCVVGLVVFTVVVIIVVKCFFTDMALDAALEEYDKGEEES